MRKRFTKYEKAENRAYKLNKSMSGTGLFFYENNTDGDLTLPKPTASGQKKVAPRARFQGDSYFKKWVGPPMNLLKYVEEISPQKNPAILESNEMEKKLILDQPDTITTRGKVEHVIDPKGRPIEKLHDSNDPKPNQPQQDMLITEDPLDGVEIILG